MLIWVEKTPPERESVTRQVSFFNREIHIPVPVIIFVNALLILLSLIVEIGPSPVKLAGLLIFLMVFFYLLTGYISVLSGSAARQRCGNASGILVCASVFLIEIPNSVTSLSPYIIPVAGMVLLTSMLLGSNAGMIMAVALPLISACFTVLSSSISFTTRQALS